DHWQCLAEALVAAEVEAWDRHSGFALVLPRFDVFVGYQGDDAHTLLELVSDEAWSSALLGRRLLCLAQTDDPALRLRPLGRHTAYWTESDWPRAPHRGAAS